MRRRLLVRGSALAALAAVALPNCRGTSIATTVDGGACTDLSPSFEQARARVANEPRVDRARVLAQLTGAASPNATQDRWAVSGTDLGVSWDDGRGHVLMAFGDTWATGGSHCPAGAWSDWRSNVLGITSDVGPHDGISFDAMSSDRAGHAVALVDGKHEKCAVPPSACPGDDCEVTKIPSGGIAANGASYLAYMSIRLWDPAPPLGYGQSDWLQNYAAVARSDDGGRTFHDVPSLRRPCGSDFAQVAYARDGCDVVVLAASSGKFGGLKIARVPEASFEDLGAYRYWDGASFQADEARASFVVPPPNGEMSLVWNTYLARWILASRDKRREAIVVRTAPAVTGPWSGARTITSSAALAARRAGIRTESWS